MAASADAAIKSPRILCPCGKRSYPRRYKQPKGWSENLNVLH